MPLRFWRLLLLIKQYSLCYQQWWNRFAIVKRYQIDLMQIFWLTWLKPFKFWMIVLNTTSLSFFQVLMHLQQPTYHPFRKLLQAQSATYDNQFYHVLWRRLHIGILSYLHACWSSHKFQSNIGVTLTTGDNFQMPMVTLKCLTINKPITCTCTFATVLHTLWNMNGWGFIILAENPIVNSWRNHERWQITLAQTLND